MTRITAKKIRIARERLNLSQPVLAAMLGVGQSTLADWERGRLPKQLAPLMRLSRVIERCML